MDALLLRHCAACGHRDDVAPKCPLLLVLIDFQGLWALELKTLLRSPFEANVNTFRSTAAHFCLISEDQGRSHFLSFVTYA